MKEPTLSLLSCVLGMCGQTVTNRTGMWWQTLTVLSLCMLIVSWGQKVAEMVINRNRRWQQ